MKLLKGTIRGINLPLISLSLCLLGNGHVYAQPLHPVIAESQALRQRHDASAARFVSCMNSYVPSQAEKRLPRERLNEIARNKCGIQELNQIAREMEVVKGKLRALAEQAQSDTRAAEDRAAKRSATQQTAAPPQKQTTATKTATSSKPALVSGNWAASCTEQNGSGGLSVVCQRYGGFLDNRLPAGCADTGNLVCQNRSLCSLAAEVVILAADASPQLQSGIESCPGHRRIRR